MDTIRFTKLMKRTRCIRFRVKGAAKNEGFPNETIPSQYKAQPHPNEGTKITSFIGGYTPSTVDRNPL